MHCAGEKYEYRIDCTGKYGTSIRTGTGITFQEHYRSDEKDCRDNEQYTKRCPMKLKDVDDKLKQHILFLPSPYAKNTDYYKHDNAHHQVQIADPDAVDQENSCSTREIG